MSAADSSVQATYHIMLLHKTFEDASNTNQHVITVLAEVLGLTVEKAAKVIKQAHENLMTPLMTCDSKSEAFKLMQALRATGVFVQIASEAGLPSCLSSGKRRRRRRKSQEPSPGRESPKQGHNDLGLGSYTETIQEGLRRTDIAGQHKHGVDVNKAASATYVSPLARTSSGTAWKQESQTVTVLPADPVEEFLKKEEEENAEREARRELRLSVEKGPSKMKSLLLKHQGQILEKVHAKEAFLKMVQMAAQELGDELGGTFGIEKKDDCGEDTEVSQEKAPVMYLTKLKREGAKLLRYLVIGGVGNEHVKSEAEKDDTFKVTAGEKEEVAELLRFMRRMDKDGSGKVDLGEFKTIAREALRERIAVQDEVHKATWHVKADTIPTWLNLGCDPIKDFHRYLSRFVDKLATSLLGKKGNFTMEDILRVTWPLATGPDIRAMIRMCGDIEREVERARVSTPPIVDHTEYDGLRSVFEFFDEDGSGEVSLDELVTKGLIYADQTDAYQRDWDRNGDGAFNMFEFCEMMCPMGFRVHAKSEIGTQTDGTRVVYDEKLKGWRYLTDDDLHQVVHHESEPTTVEKASPASEGT